MRSRRIVLAGLLVFLIVAAASTLVVLLRFRTYPLASTVIPVVQSVLETNGFQLTVQRRNDVAYMQPPFVIRLLDLPRRIRERRIRLGGVTAPYQHGYVCEYRSPQGTKLDVSVDVRGDKAYHV